MVPIYLLFFAWLICSGMKKKNKLKSYRYRSNAIVRLNAYFTFGNSIRKDAPISRGFWGGVWDEQPTDGSEEICVFLPHSLIQAEYRWVCVVQSSEPPISFTSNGNLLFVENVITVGRNGGIDLNLKISCKRWQHQKSKYQVLHTIYQYLKMSSHQNIVISQSDITLIQMYPQW